MVKIYNLKILFINKLIEIQFILIWYIRWYSLEISKNKLVFVEYTWKQTSLSRQLLFVFSLYWYIALDCPRVSLTGPRMKFICVHSPF